MDITSVVGIVGGVVACIGCVLLEEAGIVGSGYLNIPGACIIGIGTFCATAAMFTLTELMKIPAFLKITFFNKEEETGEIIETLIAFAQKARREGLLALEADIENIKDPYFQKGIQLVVDGVDPELIDEVLEIETTHMKHRHKLGEEIFMSMGGIAPTMGILGAIMGLTGALAKMGGGDIMTTVHSLAIAFIASFYGVGVANLVLIPIAMKLKRLNENEVFVRELITTGVLSIQAGDNPRIVEEKLKAFFNKAEYPIKAEAAEK
ncbi:MAG: MotA/TolQ/ExbB proton channel family protein [Nitrospirota bacterium]